MATKTYTITQTWDDSSKSPDVFTFSLPDDKPADYDLTIELTDGTKTTATVSVDTQPRYYDISFGTASLPKLTFQTPYYKITKDMFSVTIRQDAEIYEAEIENNSLTDVTLQVYRDYGSGLVAYDDEQSLSAGDFNYFNCGDVSDRLARIYVRFWTGKKYQEITIGVSKADFIKNLSAPQNVSFTFYPTAGYLQGTFRNINPIPVTAMVQVAGSDGNTYVAKTMSVPAETTSGFEEYISTSINVDGTGDVQFTTADYDWEDSESRSVAVTTSSQLYPPDGVGTSLGIVSSGTYSLQVSFFNSNNISCVASITVLDGNGYEVGASTVDVSAISYGSDTFSMRSEDTGGKVFIYYSADGYDDSDEVQDTVSDASDLPS